MPSKTPPLPGGWTSEEVVKKAIKQLRAKNLHAIELPEPFGRVDVSEVPERAATGDLSPAHWLVLSPLVIILYFLGPVVIRVRHLGRVCLFSGKGHAERHSPRERVPPHKGKSSVSIPV